MNVTGLFKIRWLGFQIDLSISITTTILNLSTRCFSSKFLRTIHPKPTPQEFTVLRRRLQQKEPRFAAECALFARLTVAARCTVGKKRGYGKVAIHGVGIVMYVIYLYTYNSWDPYKWPKIDGYKWGLCQPSLRLVDWIPGIRVWKGLKGYPDSNHKPPGPKPPVYH